ncbi:MAG: VRR-NUC domain-containing protein [Candidatus Babeliales bacterium]
MPESESGRQRLIRLEASKDGIILWRNNIGVAFHNYPIYYGVGGNGGADLIGIVDGIFLAIEVKIPGEKPSENQENFLQQVRANGGIAIVASDYEDVKRGINDVIPGRITR